MNKKNSNQVVVLFVIAAIIIVTAYIASYKSGHEIEVIETEETENSTENVFPNITTSTFSDKDHLSFKYPSNWKVEKSIQVPGRYNIQPKEGFVSEAKDNNIVISITNNCVDAGCTAVNSLDSATKQLNAVILEKVTVKNGDGAKVQFPDFKVGYVFVNGKDLVLVKTDIYLTYMNKIVSTLKLTVLE